MLAPRPLPAVSHSGHFSMESSSPTITKDLQITYMPLTHQTIKIPQLQFPDETLFINCG